MSETSSRQTARALAGLALGRREAIGLFGDTSQAFIASLLPLIVVPLFSNLLSLGDISFGRLVRDSFASVAALLVPPVVSHALATRWGREWAWLRFATAFNWCQFGLLMGAMVGLFVIGAIGGRDAAIVVVGALGLYALWLHWFLARHALGVSAGQAAALVFLVHLSTSLVVLVPRLFAAVGRG
jgi:hypothetical protein